MSNLRILRYTVPVDDQWHRIDHDGEVVHVDTRDPSVVEFWTDTARKRAQPWEYTIVGTGHRMEDGAYVGTAIVPGGALVWHLLRRPAATLVRSAAGQWQPDA